ncbi:MAG: aminotransferase class I/II-fold pyridoxal phosphate-dependent enzyme [Planctomycetes bacterium]|nr:aminotransferase class I/II-fold pyridoxal phosphate-dependent enzyme [Planctomycetota bacterium]
MAETIFYKRVSYIDWLLQRVPQAQYDLGRSIIHSKPLSELGIDLKDIALDAKELRAYQPLSHKYGVEPENIILSQGGATQALYIAYNSIVRPGDEVILEAPNYEPLYRLAVKLGGVVKILERSPEKDYQIDIEEFQRKISRNTRLVVFTNLHNPTGTFTNKDVLQAIADITRDNKCYVLCSEVYLDNILEGDPVPVCKLGNHMISVSSLSKVYGFSELRLGWSVCKDELIRKRMSILINQYLGSVSPLIDQIGTFLLRKESELLERSREIISANIEIINNWMKTQKNLKWVKPAGGTVCFIKLPPRINSMNFAQYLFEKYKTLVAPGDFFWKSGFIRITFGQNETTLKNGLNFISRAIKEFLQAM